MDISDLISTAQVALILDVKRQRVPQLINTHANFPKPIKLGARNHYFSKKELEKFIETWDRSPGARTRREK